MIGAELRRVHRKNLSSYNFVGVRKKTRPKINPASARVSIYAGSYCFQHRPVLPPAHGTYRPYAGLWVCFGLIWRPGSSLALLCLLCRDKLLDYLHITIHYGADGVIATVDSRRESMAAITYQPSRAAP